LLTSPLFTHLTRPREIPSFLPPHPTFSAVHIRCLVVSSLPDEVSCRLVKHIPPLARTVAGWTPLIQRGLPCPVTVLRRGGTRPSWTIAQDLSSLLPASLFLPSPAFFPLSCHARCVCDGSKGVTLGERAWIAAIEARPITRNMTQPCQRFL
jgi:hypothetical protein